MPDYSDVEILGMLRSSKSGARSKAFTYLYDTVYSFILGFVLKNGGSSTDAEDLFQDSLIAFYEKSIAADFKLEGSAKNYIHGIARNLWYKKFRKPKIEFSAAEIPDYKHPIDDEENVEEEKLQQLKVVFAQLSSGCQSILTCYYYEKKSMKEIADLLDLASEGVAKNKKARCLKKMKDIFQTSR